MQGWIYQRRLVMVIISLWVLAMDAFIHGSLGNTIYDSGRITNPEN